MAKQLSLSERITIERMLQSDYTFASIARKLNRSPSTISREVLNYRFFTHRIWHTGDNDCIKYEYCVRNNCCPDSRNPRRGCPFYRCKNCPDHDCSQFCKAFESTHCNRLDKPPYICIGCDQKRQRGCKKDHAYYTAHRADFEHHKTLKEAHSGIRKTPEELAAIGAVITPLIQNGQSLNHICSTHAEAFGISERTLYNYIDQGVFSVRNIDLPKKVVYKRRRERKVLTKMEYRYRQGRTYDDFKSYVKSNPELSVVEMDTVKGTRKKGNVLLTMIFRKTSFMLIFLMPDGRKESVFTVFDMLTKLLGIEMFQKLFSVILTDNGGEFKDAERLEFTANGRRRTRLFYCDPQASWQKPHIETNHRLIRRIHPQGRTLDRLSILDVQLITCHVNSVFRENLNNKTPFDMMQTEEEKKLLTLLDLQPIPPDEVLLKPTLIKH